MEEMDERADKIVQSALDSSTEMHVSIEKILVDLKSTHPLLVGDARAITQAHPELVAGLEGAARNLSAFLQLLRYFSVDLRRARGAVTE